MRVFSSAFRVDRQPLTCAVGQPLAVGAKHLGSLVLFVGSRVSRPVGFGAGGSSIAFLPEFFVVLRVAFFGECEGAPQQLGAADC
ncbi:hypothetical protein [Phormidesmis sp. 146-33]